MARWCAAAALIVLGSALAVACSEGDSKDGAAGSATPSSTAAPSAAPPGAQDEIAAGREVYLGNCIACHNPDPKLDGSLGPAIAGASAELVEARVLRAEYPPGYTPKRDTRSMVAMPFLEPRLPALIAYLESQR